MPILSLCIYKSNGVKNDPFMLANENDLSSFVCSVPVAACAHAPHVALLMRDLDVFLCGRACCDEPDGSARAREHVFDGCMYSPLAAVAVSRRVVSRILALAGLAFGSAVR